MSTDDKDVKDDPQLPFIPDPEEVENAVENVQEFLTCLQNIPMPQSETQISEDNVKKKKTAKSSKWLAPDVGLQQPVTPGVENARKKLRAFAIQKKLAQSITPKPLLTLRNPSKPPKSKSNVVTMTQNTVREIEEIKRKETRDAKMLQLAIPLWILPADQTDGTVTTKAMLPPKKLLNLEQLDELIKSAEKYEESGLIIKYTMDRESIKDPEARIRFIPVRADNMEPIDPKDKKLESTTKTEKTGNQEKSDSIQKIDQNKEDKRSRSRSISRYISSSKSIKKSDHIAHKKFKPPKKSQKISDLDGFVVCDSWSPENDSKDDSSVITKSSDTGAQKLQEIARDDHSDATSGYHDTDSQGSAILLQSDIKSLNIVAEYSSDSLEGFPYDDHTTSGSPISDQISGLNKHSIYSPDPLSTSGSPENRSERSYGAVSVSMLEAEDLKRSVEYQKPRCMDITKPTNYLLDLVKIATPFMYEHSSHNCTRKTVVKPTIEYSVSFKTCKCSSKLLQNLKLLGDQKSFILDSFVTDEHDLDFQRRKNQTWYPSLLYIFAEENKIELSTNWETDDSNQEQTALPKKTTVIEQPFRRHPNEVVIDIAEITLPPATSYEEKTLLETRTEPIDSTLDLEYDKFMQAVRSSNSRADDTKFHSESKLSNKVGSESHVVNKNNESNNQNRTYPDGDFGEDSMECIRPGTPIILRNDDAAQIIDTVVTPAKKPSSSEHWSEDSNTQKERSASKNSSRSSLRKRRSTSKKKIISVKKNKELIKKRKRKKRKVKKKLEKGKESSDKTSESTSSDSNSYSDSSDSSSDKIDTSKKKKKKKLVQKKGEKKKARLKRLNKKKKLKRLKTKQIKKKSKLKKLRESDHNVKQDDTVKKKASRLKKKKEDAKNNKLKTKHHARKQKDKSKKRKSSTSSNSSKSSESSSGSDKNNVQNDTNNCESEVFSMETLMNIKRERISDEEATSRAVANFSPRRSRVGASQEIISVSELHSEFVENNQLIIIKKEPITSIFTNECPEDKEKDSSIRTNKQSVKEIDASILTDLLSIPKTHDKQRFDKEIDSSLSTELISVSEKNNKIDNNKEKGGAMITEPLPSHTDTEIMCANKEKDHYMLTDSLPIAKNTVRQPANSDSALTKSPLSKNIENKLSNKEKASVITTDAKQFVSLEKDHSLLTDSLLVAKNTVRQPANSDSTLTKSPLSKNIENKHSNKEKASVFTSDAKQFVCEEKVHSLLTDSLPVAKITVSQPANSDSTLTKQPSLSKNIENKLTNKEKAIITNDTKQFVCGGKDLSLLIDLLPIPKNTVRQTANSDIILTKSPLSKNIENKLSNKEKASVITTDAKQFVCEEKVHSLLTDSLPVAKITVRQSANSDSTLTKSPLSKNIENKLSNKEKASVITSDAKQFVCKEKDYSLLTDSLPVAKITVRQPVNSDSTLTKSPSFSKNIDKQLCTKEKSNIISSDNKQYVSNEAEVLTLSENSTKQSAEDSGSYSQSKFLTEFKKITSIARLKSAKSAELATPTEQLFSQKSIPNVSTKDEVSPSLSTVSSSEEDSSESSTDDSTASSASSDSSEKDKERRTLIDFPRTKSDSKHVTEIPLKQTLSSENSRSGHTAEVQHSGFQVNNRKVLDIPVPKESMIQHAIETVITSANIRGEIKCDWKPSELSNESPDKSRKPSRWGVTKRQEMDENNSHMDISNASDGKVFRIRSILDPPSPAEIKFECDTPEDKEVVYKIETISSVHKYSNSSPNSYDTAYADMFGESDQQTYGDCFSEPHQTYEEVKISPKPVSLDDRINMALKYLGGVEQDVKVETVKIEESVENKDEESVVKKEAATPLEDPPDKGILVMTIPKMNRPDPRVPKNLKRVSFADGFAPGQDSDIDEPPAKRLKESKETPVIRYGCAWPCPPWHEDYDPEWDALPPPPPPLGSPPPPPQPLLPPLHLLRPPPLLGHRGNDILVPPHHNKKDEKSYQPSTSELQTISTVTRLPKGLGHPDY